MQETTVTAVATSTPNEGDDDLPAFLKTVSASCPPSTEATPPVRRRPLPPPERQHVATGKIVGASLLCFVVDPVWSRVYFLLGKERKMHNWRQGSEKWSDFGGKTSPGAPTAEETAAKEFWEESLAVVKYFADDALPRKHYGDIARSLRRGEYLFQIQILFGTATDPRHHVTFVKQIPWDPHVVFRFNKCRRRLMLHRNLTVPPSLDDDDDDDKLMLRCHPCLVTEVARHCQHRRRPRRVCRTMPPLSSSSLSSAGNCTGPTTTELLLLDRGCRSWHVVVSAASSSTDAPAEGPDAWMTPHRRRRTRTLPPRSSKPHRPLATDAVSRPTRDDFFEKQAVGFWSIPQLQRAVELKGVLLKRDGKTEKCRASFTTLLELVLSELAFLRPDVF